MFQRVYSGAPWEQSVGYCRALRAGPHIYVTGTTSVTDDGQPYAPGDPEAQAARCLELIEAAIIKLGASKAHIVRTRMFVTDITQWEAFGRAHQAFFGEHHPTTTMVEVSAFISHELLIEIEAELYCPVD